VSGPESLSGAVEIVHDRGEEPKPDSECDPDTDSDTDLSCVIGYAARRVKECAENSFMSGLNPTHRKS